MQGEAIKKCKIINSHLERAKLCVYIIRKRDRNRFTTFS